MTAGLPVLVTDVCGYAPHIAQADAGVMLPAPYSQTEMNHALVQMLQSSQQAQWRDNGMHYTNNIKNTSSDSAEADYIIALAQTRGSSRD